MKIRRFIFLFTGPPATGKSTIAQGVAEVLSQRAKVVHLQSDALRRMIVHPMYTKKESGVVYGSLYVLSAYFINKGYSVVVDATFPRKRQRLPFKRLALRTHSLFLIFRVTASLQTCLLRNSERKGWQSVPPSKLVDIYKSFEEEEGQYSLDTDALNAADASRLALNFISEVIDSEGLPSDVPT